LQKALAELAHFDMEEESMNRPFLLLLFTPSLLIPLPFTFVRSVQAQPSSLNLQFKQKWCFGTRNRRFPSPFQILDSLSEIVKHPD